MAVSERHPHLLLGLRSHHDHDPPGPSDTPLHQDDFEQLVSASLDELPLEYLKALDHVPVLVADDGGGRRVRPLPREQVSRTRTRRHRSSSTATP